MSKLPGDNIETLEQMIRVNHAGEYGAKRIYEGQLFALKNSSAYDIIKHMAEQEKEHLDYFDKRITQDNVRPTLLHPIWHVGGFALGAVTGFMGKKAAMACTEAVEDVIEQHYQQQIDQLNDRKSENDENSDGNNNKDDLLEKITRFRQEEIEHRDIGIEQNAQQATAYKPLRFAVQNITKLAIRLSKKI